MSAEPRVALTKTVVYGDTLHVVEDLEGCQGRTRSHGERLAGCRRSHRRYEREAEHFLAFVGIALS
ncbi:hypothetical protein [Streptomyces phaeochromogenes]